MTVGGVVIDDRFDDTSSYGYDDGDVTGLRNGNVRLTLPNAVDGPLTVTTAGGSASLAGPTWTSPSFVQFDGVRGSPSGTGQTITIVGRG